MVSDERTPRGSPTHRIRKLFRLPSLLTPTGARGRGRGVIPNLSLIPGIMSAPQALVY